MKYKYIQSFFTLVLASTLYSQNTTIGDVDMGETRNSEAFNQVKKLLGKWEGKLYQQSGAVVDTYSEFRLVSNGNSIVETLIEKVKRALKKTKYKRCVIAGGVAANSLLREKIQEVNPGKDFVFPDLSFCTDNAAMISFLAEIKLNSQSSKSFSNFSFSALPNLRL